MHTDNYLKTMSENTSFWWNDDADYSLLDEAIANGATGVTTNPVIVGKSLYKFPEFWRPYIADAMKLSGDEKAEAILKAITCHIAEKFKPIYDKYEGKQGFVCAQVNPKKQGDAAFMVEMGKRLAAWAPNVAVKIPATAAGIEALEELAAEGITTVGTVSFSTPQAVAIAEAQQRGIDRCRKAGKKPGMAFSVIMVGRTDDYLRDVIHDGKFDISEEAITHAGTACIKKAYRIIKEKGLESRLMPAAMRGTYHPVALADADMSMSIAPNMQKELIMEKEFVPHIDEEVDQKYIDELMKCPEFERAYCPEKLPVKDFITFGATQRTLSQFVEVGWNKIAAFEF